MSAPKGPPVLEDGATRDWQRRLLPFMMGAIIVMGVFFFVASLGQLYYLHDQMRHAGFSLESQFEAFEARRGPAVADDAAYMAFKARSLLEQDLVQRRYHQVNSAMLSRVWTRYLGFVTGMILALVGAAFILGKLRELPTMLETNTKILTASIYSSSPGLVLAVLGTILMAITLAIPFELDTRDVAVYLRDSDNFAASLPPPPPLDLEARERDLFGDGAPPPRVSGNNSIDPGTAVAPGGGIVAPPTEP